MKLYKLTNAFGEYFVVAEDFSSAEQKLLQALQIAKYGNDRLRKVIKIDLLTEQLLGPDSPTDKMLVL